MKWNDYKELVNICSDSELRPECGIRDNYKILHAENDEWMMEKILSSGKYSRHSLENDEVFEQCSRMSTGYIERLKNSFSKHNFEYNPGTVIVDVWDDLTNLFTVSHSSEELEKHISYQKKFSSGIVLHPDNIRKIEDKKPLRAMSEVLVDIVENIFVYNNVSFCLPSSFIYHLGKGGQNFSKIV